MRSAAWLRRSWPRPTFPRPAAALAVPRGPQLVTVVAARRASTPPCRFVHIADRRASPAASEASEASAGSADPNRASRPRPTVRPAAAYPHGLPILTRWTDNDMYGHVNNTRYHEFFDVCVNDFLIQRCGLDPAAAVSADRAERAQGLIGFVAHNAIDYLHPVAYPQRLYAKLRIARIGRTSATYQLALFAGPRGQDPATFPDDEWVCAALGTYVHVYVNAETHQPQALPRAYTAAMQALMAQQTD